MKITVWCDNGANAHSKREEVIDLYHDWNISDEEWIEMNETERDQLVQEWAYNKLDIGYEEIQ